MQSLSSDYFNQHSKVDDNLKGKFDIKFGTPNATQTSNIFQKNKAAIEFTIYAYFQPKYWQDINVKDNKKPPITNFEIPEALKDIQFSKTYFSNGLVTLTDNQLPLHDEKKRIAQEKQCNVKIQKECSHKRKDINLRLSMEEKGAKSVDKSRMQKSHALEKDDACRHSNNWTDLDTVNLAPNK